MEAVRPTGRRYWEWALAFAFLGLLCTLLYFRSDQAINKIFLVLVLGIGLELVVFRKRVLMGLCFLFIPVSMQLDIMNSGARLALPTELFAIILGSWFLIRATHSRMLDRRILYHPVSILLFVDLLWLLVSTTFSSMPEVSFKRLALRVLVVVFFYLMTAHWLLKDKNKPKPLLFYAIGLLPVVLLTLKKHARFDFIPQVTFTICQPWYSDHTIYGACLAFVIPMMLIFLWNWRVFGINFSNRTLLFATLLILLVGEFLAFSRAAWISLILVSILAIAMKWKIRFYMIGLIVLVAGLSLFIFYEPIMLQMKQNESVSNKGDITEHFESVTNLETDASNLERINRWICAWRMFQDRPVTGFGPGTYQFQYGPYQTFSQKTYISTDHGDRGNAHSEYLTYLSEQGFPGLLIFISWVGFVIALGMNLVYQSRDPVMKLMCLGALLGLCTFFTHGLFNTFIDQDKMAGLVFPAIALLVVMDIQRKAQKKTGTHV